MEIVLVDLGHCTVLRLIGRFDVTVAEELGNRLRELTDSGHVKLVISLKDVVYMNVSCLRELVAVWKRCVRCDPGYLILCEANKHVFSVLVRTGLVGTHSRIMYAATETEAIGSW